jgi:hypothetical protein
MGGGGGGGGGNAGADAAAKQAADEAARQERISSGMGTINSMFSPYNNEYYDKLGTDYKAYYQPQLDTELDKAKQKQTFNLANQGLSNSSFASKAATDLAKAYQTNQQQVSGGANDYQNKAKASVEGVRNDLIAQLNQSANPNQINQSSLNRIAITPVNSLTPLSNLFADVTGVLANGASAYQSNQGGINAALYQDNDPFGQQGKSQSSSSSRIVS